jgi:transposase
MLFADRGYDATDQSPCRREARLGQHLTKIHRKEPICFSPYLYGARNLAEWFFNKIKQCRRIATRYDKLAANYLAFVQLASIWLWPAKRPRNPRQNQMSDAMHWPGDLILNCSTRNYV